MIYLDVSPAVNGRAGLGRYAASLARALADSQPGRYALFYNQTPQGRPVPSLADLPARRVRLGYKPWRMLVWVGQIARLGFDRLLDGAELFHATEHLLMPLRHTPGVLTVHDLIFRRYPQHHKRLNYWFLNAAMPLFVRRADHIIAISECTKRDLIELYGTPAEKISVVYEAAAPGFTPPTPEAIEAVRERYDLPERCLLTVGTIEPRKNLSRLARALARLRRDDPSLGLVIVGGKGWLYDDFFRTVEELGLSDALTLPGYVPDDDLPAMYGAATLMVVPSLYEGFGLPVLEAMACGAPVACSRAASLPEIGGEAAVYFEPSDLDEMTAVIGGLLRDPDRLRAMREAGLEQAARFSWARAAEETAAVYARVLESARRAGDQAAAAGDFRGAI
jgi:glycosyltransferase involved in cell wall biosynthesis